MDDHGRYLDSIPAAATRASYDDTLARLIAVPGGASLVAVLAPDDFAVVMDRWNGAAAATSNRHLSALTSFTTWHSATNSWPPTRPAG